MSSKCKDHFFNSSLKPPFTNISLNIDNYNNNSSTQKHLELASGVISPQQRKASVLANWEMPLDKLTLTCYGRITSLVVNTSSSSIELQLQSWRLASVSCWPASSDRWRVAVSLARNAHLHDEIFLFCLWHPGNSIYRMIYDIKTEKYIPLERIGLIEVRC